MGEVILLCHSRLGAKSQAKVLPPALSACITGFEREAHVPASLTILISPKVIGFQETHGFRTFAMELAR